MNVLAEHIEPMVDALITMPASTIYSVVLHADEFDQTTTISTIIVLLVFPTATNNLVLIDR